MNPPTSSLGKPAKDRIESLDLLRGVAAIGILVYHAAKYLGVQLLPNGYLAVDLFFLLSGFVIAHNYDRKFAAGMSLSEFAAQRLIRLYPCFLLAFATGFILTVVRMARDMGYFDGWRLLATAALNAMFIPSYLVPYRVYEDIYPYNGAQWSLAFELAVNFLYWMIFPFLKRRFLILLISAAAIAEAVTVVSVGNLDVGMRPTDFWLGVPRVLLPFFIGIALRRHIYSRAKVQLSNFGMWIPIFVLGLTFSLSRFFGSNSLPVTEFATVSIVFPVLLVLLCRTRPSGRMEGLCKLTGDASYPLYLLQVSFIGLFAALSQLLLHAKASAFVPYVGIAFIITTFVAAVWIDRRFELPVRKRLTAAWRSHIQHKSIKSTAANSPRLPAD